MKFVHIADMHFDSPFTLLSSRAELGEIRRVDQRKAFKKVIEYINNLFKEIKETKIFITPGNHDPYLNNSYYNKYKWSDNVKIFNSEIEKIELPEFDLYGYGFSDYYCVDSEIENIKIQNKEKLNILITHASLDGGYDEQRNYNTLSSKKLKEIGFDYIALGHIHKCNLSEENKNIIYPGSTVSMGFDELGSHGMIVGNLNKNDLKIEFIKLDDKEFKEINLDISEINTIEELIEKVNEIQLEENNLYKIILIGKRKFEINTYKLFKLLEIKNIIKIKDKTILDYNLEEIANDFSLKGIFAKEMLKKLNDENLDKEIVQKAIEIGMNIL